MYIETDTHEVETVVNLYLEGLYERKFDLLEKAFWEESRNVGVTAENEFWLKTMDFWEEKCKKPPTHNPEAKRTFSIENIDIWHNSAMVKVKMVIKYPERIYECTDYLSLLKMNEEWKIYNKLWSARNIEIDQ